MLATTIHKSNTTPHHQSEATTSPSLSPVSHTGRRDSGPVVSKPNSVSGNSLTGIDHSNPEPAQRLSCTRTTPTTGVAHPTNRPAHGDPRYAGRPGSRGAP